MPPKPKPKNTKDEKDEPNVAASPGKVLPTEREIQLKKQLDLLSEELVNTKSQVSLLQQENEFLQQEAQQIRVETHEYLAFMSRKTQKRQSAVISLSDRHAEQIVEINKQKEDLLQKFEKEKEELKKEILDKETILSGIRSELDELHEFQVLQEEQQKEMVHLEKKVSDMRSKHNEDVQQLKANFLKDKNAFQAESENQLNALSKEATKEAYHCLNQHTLKIKEENRKMRKELLELIKKSRAMHKHKLELEEQKKVLLQEKEYVDKLHVLKTKQNNHLLKTEELETDESSNKNILDS